MLYRAGPGSFHLLVAIRFRPGFAIGHQYPRCATPMIEASRINYDSSSQRPPRGVSVATVCQ